MKISLFVLFMAMSSLVFGQKATQTVHVKDIQCKYDTIADLYEGASLKIAEDATKKLSVIAEGNNKILIVSIQSTECECADCSESFQFAVVVDSLEMNIPHNLTSKDLTWVYSNSWIQSKFITSYLGNITMTDKNSFTIKLSELLGTSVIRNINISTKTR